MESRGDMCALPEGCIANVLALTSPRDACRLCAVCNLFCSASESDAVWERLLPPDYQSIVSRSDDNTSLSVSSSSSKKRLYLSLCHNPILIDRGAKSFSLDKASGKKCFMLSARDLLIIWGDTPQYWRWISDPDSRFEQVAELVRVCWLEIRGKINTYMLSPGTLYEGYLVFKSRAEGYGLEHPVDVTVGLVGEDNCDKRTVYLTTRVPMRMGLQGNAGIGDAIYPKERGDGWLEAEFGEFFCKGDEEGELEMSVWGMKTPNWKSGLVVEGIEIRPKPS